MLIDFFLSTTIGYSLVHGWTEDQLKANHYHSGHLVRILGRGTANPASHVFLDNFILRHEAYINPIYFVMNNDHVTLMGASKTHVWFSVSPNYNVYTIGKIPFAFLAQYLKSEQLLIVDHATAHKMAEQLNSPQGNCILVNNTARCGSTLICQIFKRVPNTLVQSEPWALTYIHRLYNEKQIGWKEHLALIESFVKLQFKPTKSTKTERYVIKLPLLCGALFKPIKDIFGDRIKFLFSVRHLRPSITSFVKVISTFEPEDIEVKGDFWLGSIGLPYEDKYKPIYAKYYSWRKTLTDTENIALASGAVLAGFLANKSSYHYIAVYEEMMSDIQGSIKKMFQALNIPLNMHECIQALDKHSQNKIFDTKETQLISQQDWQRADDILEELDLPLSTSMSTEDFINITGNLPPTPPSSPPPIFSSLHRSPSLRSQVNSIFIKKDLRINGSSGPKSF